MQLVNIKFNPCGKEYTYLVKSDQCEGRPIRVGDKVIVDSPFSGTKAVDVTSLKEPYPGMSGWDLYKRFKIIVKHIPMEQPVTIATTDFSKEKFCVIGTNSNCQVNNRTWFDTYKEAEQHARDIIKSQHGSKPDVSLLIVKTISVIKTPEPNIIVKMVKALKGKKRK